MKLNSKQVGSSGEHFVAAEIHRRGGYAVTFSGNMQGIDLLATDVDHERKVSIQVKTRTSGSWHANLARDSRKGRDDPLDEKFWIFVDLSERRPAFYIARASWVQNDIYEAHAAYLARHGGQRPSGKESQHHAIQEERIRHWKSRWDILGILPPAEP